jgi:hypothetical protein
MLVTLWGELLVSKRLLKHSYQTWYSFYIVQKYTSYLLENVTSSLRKFSLKVLLLHTKEKFSYKFTFCTDWTCLQGSILVTMLSFDHMVVYKKRKKCYLQFYFLNWSAGSYLWVVAMLRLQCSEAVRLSKWRCNKWYSFQCFIELLLGNDTV